MSILLWITTEMEYKIKCCNRSLLLPRVVIKLTIEGLTKSLKTALTYVARFCYVCGRIVFLITMYLLVNFIASDLFESVLNHHKR